MDGFLFIDKEIDWTSRDVCNKIQGLVHEKKVGHTGTLDPFATGLLIVALGAGTKLIPYLDELDKTYVAELTLGKKTNTGDLTGEVIEEKEIPNLTKDKIIEVFNSFIGEQEQLPPMTSAIHVNGQILYKLAHKGIEIDRPKRKITVHSINLISYEENRIVFITSVSKGTYIRTLGEDLAEALGTVGHLTGLRRTGIAKYNLNGAVKVNDVTKEKVIPLTNMINQFMETVYLNATYTKKVKDGVPLEKEVIGNNKSNTVFLASKETNEPLAIYELVNGKYRCKKGLWK